MSENKQIEEMAKVINEMDERNAHYYDEYMQECEAFADANAIAKAFYNAGYRLATEVAEEIFAEIEKRFMYRANDAYKGDIFIDSVDFAELKKKYTEGEK